MNHSIRVPAVLLVLTVMLALAFLPFGQGGQNQQMLVTSLVGPDFALYAAPNAMARRVISIPFGIDSPLDFQANGHLIYATVPVGCEQEAGAKFHVRVELTQETTGALAKGHTQGFCTGDVASQTVRAAKRGPNGFTAGPAEGCVWLTIRVRNEVTDAVEWCEDVSLARASD